MYMFKNILLAVTVGVNQSIYISFQKKKNIHISFLKNDYEVMIMAVYVYMYE